MKPDPEYVRKWGQPASPTERKFRIGQRVRLSDAGKEKLLPWGRKMKVNTRGTVKAHFSTLGVIVHVDGYFRPASYHMDFWEPLRQTESRNDSAAVSTSAKERK